MSRRIRWTKRALKGVGRLDQTTRDRILSAIEELVEEKRGDIKRLRGADQMSYRLRVGKWRVIFSYLDEESLVVLRVGARGNVYK